MYTRHNEVLQLISRKDTVDAGHYNSVQIGLKRLNREIRFRIPGLKHLDLILQKDAWIVVDIVLNDIPIMAWMNFESDQRGSLHEPIACELRFFHHAAKLIMEKTLKAMELMLREELASDFAGRTSNVAELIKTEVVPKNWPAS